MVSTCLWNTQGPRNIQAQVQLEMSKVPGDAPHSAMHNFNVKNCEDLCVGVCAHNCFHYLSLSPPLSSCPPTHTSANIHNFFPKSFYAHMAQSLMDLLEQKPEGGM